MNNKNDSIKYQDFDKLLELFIKKIIELENMIKDREEHINNLKAMLQERDKSIGAAAQELKDQKGHINKLEENIRIKEKNIESLLQEIKGIYNSETYRFIVRPVILPCLSVVKRIAHRIKKLFDLLKFFK
ncbi:MAG: hypothetical protein ABH952_10870 [Candidatus Omnitrophota bacterium]